MCNKKNKIVAKYTFMNMLLMPKFRQLNFHKCHIVYENYILTPACSLIGPEIKFGSASFSTRELLARASSCYLHFYRRQTLLHNG
jgi:hypothetical protein